MLKMTGSKDISPLTVPFRKVFVENQFKATPQWPAKNADLSDKVAIITGSNQGLGFESARQMLSYKLGRLIIAVRSVEKGEAAATKLRSLEPKSKAIIEVWKLDMNSYESIQAFAKRVDTQLVQLDIAILNAGLMRLKFGTVQSTGHEETMQVNYLSTALLGILLLPILKNKSQGGPGRLTIVNAALSLTVTKLPNSKAPRILSSFDDSSAFSYHDRYNESKVLAHMFLWKLVDFVSADDVIVNLVCPGWVKGTGLARDFPGVVQILGKAVEAIAARSHKVGASTYLDATINKGKESHGTFLMSWHVTP